MTIPESLAVDFRIAETRDVKSWSFGAVTSPRHASATFDDNVKGTLHDQRIFGPVHDFRCACGKYVTDQYAGLICDICGVKCASSSVRKTRFGHIDFIEPIQHPFAPDVRLRCFPVLPAAFAESQSGQRLQELYDELIEVAVHGPAPSVPEAVAAVVDHLTPVAVVACRWRLVDYKTLARGLALENRAGNRRLPPLSRDVSKSAV